MLNRKMTVPKLAFESITFKFTKTKWRPKNKKKRHIDVYYLNQLTLEAIIKDKSGFLLHNLDNRVILKIGGNLYLTYVSHGGHFSKWPSRHYKYDYISACSRDRAMIVMSIPMILYPRT